MNLARDRKIEAISFVFGECRVALPATKLSSPAFCEKKAGYCADDIARPAVNSVCSAKQLFSFSSD
jgi:hypothetical protein